MQPGLVHHSDRGFQYAGADYVALMEKHGMVPSMSRPVNPYDKAYASYCTSTRPCVSLLSKRRRLSSLTPCAR